MPDASDDEKALSEFFERYVAEGKPGGRKFAMRHPVMTFDALRRLHSMPATTFTPSTAPEADEVLRALADRPGWAALRSAVSTLQVPIDGTAFAATASKQTLRRKGRAAEKAGVTWRPIDDSAERFALLTRADAYERDHARETYRNANADNSHLLGMRLWLGAFGADGEPLMLSITPYDGEWAALYYFRTFSDDPAASDARYLMSAVLVEHLGRLGVRRLVDTVHPIHLPNGLRHFQRMVGFRLEHVRFDTARSARTTPQPFSTDAAEAFEPRSALVDDRA